ncbi:thiolase family protein [Glycomyces buryatensis]|uniref:Probable acetyl-CoA acetyltransferase n=1 Tax=Glycomyces buryatensis TaxID=2570927 RepID=A0A4S8Q7R5_9ACTN|nr:acetyl-CoA C-acyltransferase [Glycomyces buryatensis]THV36374.1 acetyl-CoA C-acyltransferase [Glycomyces buryatensis]
MNCSYILDAVRTPIGRHRRALSAVRPDDLAAAVVAAVRDRNLRVDPSEIDDVVFGNANGAGEENRDVARMAVLLAGLPESVPGTTVNRLCGSGLEAVVQAARAVETGDASLVVAGGVESMSRAPWVLPKTEQPLPRGGLELADTALGWRLVNPAMKDEWTVSLGEGAEILADEFGIGREAQDAFALRSHQSAHAAWEDGRFDDEVLKLPELGRDEAIRPDTTSEALLALRPVFRPDGTVTAGNASPLSDGAAALMIGDEAAARDHGRPLARIVARAVVGVEPRRYGIGPVEAARQALGRAGIGWGDLTAVELNEAYAAQALACLSQWPELDPAIVNRQGGAIALGHPLGCSGARLAGTLAWQLHRDGGYGLAALCIGVGQGIAMVLEGC